MAFEHCPVSLDPTCAHCTLHEGNLYCGMLVGENRIKQQPKSIVCPIGRDGKGGKIKR